MNFALPEYWIQFSLIYLSILGVFAIGGALSVHSPELEEQSKKQWLASHKQQL